MGRQGVEVSAGAAQRMERANMLIRAGVGVLAADDLLQACAQDSELVCAIVPLTGVRVGDRMRVALPSGRRSLVIELVASASAGKSAIVGRPVGVSRADDVAPDAPVRLQGSQASAIVFDEFDERS